LLIRQGADINRQLSDGGETVLMSAAANGKTEVVGVLLENGADVNLKDDRGFTALTYAKIGNHDDVVELLRKHGAR
jgi:ankyrin repeat protein